MDKMAWYCFAGGYIMFFVATLLYWAYAAGFVLARRGRSLAAFGAGGGMVTPTDTVEIGKYALVVHWLGFLSLTAWLVFRTIATGHGPYGSQYEFAIAFAWGANFVFLILERQYHVRHLGALFMLVPLALMTYSTTIPASIDPLIPALQNNLMLTIHVAMAVVAYGGFTVAFCAAVLYLINRQGAYWWLPDPKLLDELAHKSVIIGFPMMFMNLVLGAYWASVAWGAYWSWDPKETAALATWLVYGMYMHARTQRGWKGVPSAVLLIVGFAATLFTFFGVNIFIPGLHSYSGL